MKKYQYAWYWLWIMIIGAPYLVYLYVFKEEIDGSDIFMTLMIGLCVWLNVHAMRSVVIDFAEKTITVMPFLRFFPERSFSFDDIARLESDPFSVTAHLADGRCHKFYDLCLRRSAEFRKELARVHEKTVS